MLIGNGRDRWVFLGYGFLEMVFSRLFFGFRVGDSDVCRFDGVMAYELCLGGKEGIFFMMLWMFPLDVSFACFLWMPPLDASFACPFTPIGDLMSSGILFLSSCINSLYVSSDSHKWFILH